MSNPISRGWVGRIKAGLPLAFLCFDAPLQAADPASLDPRPPGEIAEIYERATNLLAEALLFKPATSVGDSLTSRLAPWIFQEVSDGTKPGGSGRDELGLFVQTNGRWTVDKARPTLYTELDEVELRGKVHPRLAYLWCYPLDQAGSTALELQGIRITLNRQGEPAIWEVLTDDSDAAVLFVSQSVESAARSQFGPPLPRRQHSIEADATPPPGAVVARVIEEGPTPLGPLVYLRAGNRSVVTLTCRCMAAQAKKLAGTEEYHQLPLTPGTAALFKSLRAARGGGAAFWPSDLPVGSRLEDWLRLPDSF